MLFASLGVASGIWLWILCDSFWCLTYCLQPEFFWRLWLCPGFYHTEYSMVLMQSDFLTVGVYPADLFSVCKFSNTCSEFPNSVVHRGSELLSWLNTSLFGVAPHTVLIFPWQCLAAALVPGGKVFPAASPISTGWFELSCYLSLVFLLALVCLLFPSICSSITSSSSSCPSSLPHVRENSSELPILKDGHCFSWFSLWSFLFYFVIKSEMFSAVTHLLW